MIQSNQEYDTDFCAWSEHQAELLRNKEFDKLDILNLIEEIADLGKSEKRALESQLNILLMHMLKVKFQPEKHSRSWDSSMKISHQKVKRELRQNPSLKHKLKKILNDAYEDSRVLASRETGLDEEVFPEECPWTIEELKILEG